MEKLDTHAQVLELLILRVYEDLALLSQKPGEVIERQFRDKVYLPLKEVMAHADRIQAEITHRTGIEPYLVRKPDQDGLKTKKVGLWDLLNDSRPWTTFGGQ